jgi:hypothetical protein
MSGKKEGEGERESKLFLERASTRTFLFLAKKTISWPRRHWGTKRTKSLQREGKGEEKDRFSGSPLFSFLSGFLL